MSVKATRKKIGIREFKDVAFFLFLFLASAITVYISFFPLKPVVYWIGGYVIDLTMPTVFTAFFSLYLSLGWVWYAVSGFVCSFIKRGKLKENDDPDFKFSILIAAHNEENVISNILSDLKNQTYRNFETIVICHNCTDRTYEVVCGLSKGNPWIKPIKFLGEYGKPHALNYGVKSASGELITVFDADSRIDKDYLEKVTRYFPKYDGVQTLIQASNPNYNVLTQLIDLEYVCYTDLVQYSRSGMGFNAIFGGTGQTIKRQVLENVGFWDADLVEDYSLSVKVTLKDYKVAYTTDTKVYDEKVPFWKPFFKQRARWLRGDYQITKKYLSKAWRKPDYLHLLFSAFGILFYIYSYFCVMVYLFGGQVIQFYFPTTVWLPLFLIQQSVAITRIGITRGIKKICYYPLLFLYIYHWIPALFYTPFVKTWKESKTPHGFFTTR